jgi:hypothetical protein
MVCGVCLRAEWSLHSLGDGRGFAWTFAFFLLVRSILDRLCLRLIWDPQGP